MFSRIMVPVDLAHRETLGRSIECAGDLAKHYGAEVFFIGVTSNIPSSAAHSAKEYEERLGKFADEISKRFNISVKPRIYLSNDPISNIDDVLLEAVKDTQTDLVMMQSHVPNVMDYVWPSNGGKLAEHARCSVMLIRDP